MTSDAERLREIATECFYNSDTEYRTLRRIADRLERIDRHEPSEPEKIAALAKVYSAKPPKNLAKAKKRRRK